MGRGVSGKSEVLLVLPDDLVDHRSRNPVAAETSDGQVISITEQPVDRIRDRRHLVGHRAGLLLKVGPGGDRRRIGEELAGTLFERVHRDDFQEESIWSRST